MQQRVKKIIKKLALKYNLTFEETNLAVLSYYEKIREVLEKGNYPEHETFEKILIPGFGRFIPNEHKIIKSNEQRRERDFREYYLGEIPGFKLTPEYRYLQGISDTYDRWGNKKNKIVQHQQPIQTGGRDIRGIQDQTKIQPDSSETKI